MRFVVVVQARMRSSRLPGKVLERISGKPMLERMLDRIALAKEPDEVVVATTWDPADQPIIALCQRLGIACYEGHPTDCLDRHQQIAAQYRADAVVKIPSDCPLIDPRVIDRVLGVWRQQPTRYDYLSNLHPASWPDGNDVEVIAARALALAANEAEDPFEREHTTPFLWSQPERFRIGNVRRDQVEDLSQRFRWVVDWPEDLNVVRRVFDALLPEHGAGFSVEDILALHAREPSLERMNLAHRGYSYAADWRAPKRAQLLRIEGAPT
jgi:spore coat polysaccharide biosynthesis protein SpsF